MYNQKNSQPYSRTQLIQQSLEQENTQVLSKLKDILSSLIYEKQTIQKRHVKQITAINQLITQKDSIIQKLNEEIKVKDKFIQLMFKQNQNLQGKLQHINKMTRSSSVTNLTSSFQQTNPILIKNYSKPSINTRQSASSIKARLWYPGQQSYQSSPKQQYFQNRLVNINNYFNDLKGKMQEHLKLIDEQKQRWSSTQSIETIRKTTQLKTLQQIQGASMFQKQNKTVFKTQPKTSRSIYQSDNVKIREFQTDKTKSHFNVNYLRTDNLTKINEVDLNKCQDSTKNKGKIQPFFKRRRNVHQIQHLNLQHKKSGNQLNRL